MRLYTLLSQKQMRALSVDMQFLRLNAKRIAGNLLKQI